MELVKKFSFVFYTHLPNPEVFCKVFKDNQSCISVAESNKLSPRTKHIAINYHHPQSSLQKKVIQICYIDTKEKTADIFTKSFDQALFIYIQRKLSGWWIKKWNNCFDTRDYLNTKNNTSSQLSQLIRLKWKFVFWN